MSGLTMRDLARHERALEIADALSRAADDGGRGAWSAELRDISGELRRMIMESDQRGGAVSATIDNLQEEIGRLKMRCDHLRKVNARKVSADLHEAESAEMRAEIERLRARVAVLEDAKP